MRRFRRRVEGTVKGRGPLLFAFFRERAMKRLLLLLLLLASAGAAGSDKDGYTAVVSGRSCREFIELRQKQGEPNADVRDTASLMDYSHALGWIAGYITALNWQTPDTYQMLGDSDFKSTVLWIENYCKEHPSNDISRGMRALTITLYPHRYKTKKEAETRSGQSP